MSTLVITPERIAAEVRLYEHLKQQLLTEIPDIDDETLSDTLDGATNFKELLSEVVRSALQDEAYSGALRGRIADMKLRLERIEARADIKREIALRALANAGIPKLIAEDFTAFIKQAPAGLEIVEEAKIPEQFWKPQAPKLDRQALIAALRVKTEIAGARLAPPKYQLTVRSK